MANRFSFPVESWMGRGCVFRDFKGTRSSAFLLKVRMYQPSFLEIRGLLKGQEKFPTSLGSDPDLGG